MTQRDLPLAEQIADLPPEMQGVHRRYLTRGRYERRISKWWFDQARKAVDEAPEPETRKEETP